MARYALAVAAVVFVALALERSWGDVRAYDWALSWGWLVLSAVLFMVMYVMQALAWQWLLRAFGQKAPTVWAVTSWATTILARYVPGSVFMFVGRLLSSQRRGLEGRRVSAAMVYEQALAFCAALVTLGLLLPFSEYRRGTIAVSLLGIPLILVLLHPRVFVPLADRVLGLFHREPLGASLGLGKVGALLCYYVAAWAVAGLACWTLLCGVTDAGAGLLPEVTAAFAFAYCVGMVAFVFPSGLGVREVVLASALGGTLGTAAALAWAVLLRLWIIASEVVFAVVATLAQRIRGGDHETAGETGSTED